VYGYGYTSQLKNENDMIEEDWSMMDQSNFSQDTTQEYVDDELNDEAI
jgi:hypothetical protein